MGLGRTEQEAGSRGRVVVKSQRAGFRLRLPPSRGADRAGTAVGPRGLAHAAPRALDRRVAGPAFPRLSRAAAPGRPAGGQQHPRVRGAALWAAQRRARPAGQPAESCGQGVPAGPGRSPAHQGSWRLRMGGAGPSRAQDRHRRAAVLRRQTNSRPRSWAAATFGERRLRFRPVPDFFERVERLGHVPLPPYIDRADRPEDRERYQTVYARERGSVAAPTAGLHFTPEILGRMRERGIEIAEITLHVGLGTFQPVRAERVEEHKMHSEWFSISEEAAAKINARGRRRTARGRRRHHHGPHSGVRRARDRARAAPAAARPTCSSIPGFDSGWWARC